MGGGPLKASLGVVAATVLALVGAPAGSASPTVTAEPGGTPCPEVVAEGHETTGGCTLHAVTNAEVPLTIRVHLAGMGETVVSACASEMAVAIQSSGHGFLYDHTLIGSTCAVAPCDEPSPSHAELGWPFDLVELAGSLRLTTTLCLRLTTAPEGTVGPNGVCTIAANLVATGAHDYEIQALGGLARCSQGPDLSIAGAWHVENRSGGANPLEVAH